MRSRNMAMGAVAITSASAIAKFTDAEYEALKESGGVIVPLLFLVCTLLLMIWGVLTMFRRN